MASTTRPTCLELFAGCGGLGYGFHKEGFDIVCANELDPAIAKTYEENFPDTTVITGDITQDDIKARMYECFDRKECDVIIGGPPCVAYSMAGRRNARDPRGQLYRDYVEIVSRLRPKAFVMENVKGILTILHDKPTLTEEEQAIADRYYEMEARRQTLLEKRKALTIKKETDTEEFAQVKRDLQAANVELKKRKSDIPKFRINVTEIIKSDFEKLGYDVEMKLLNAANYGVPQKRERVIFIGYRNDLGMKGRIEYPVETHHPFGDEGKLPWVTVRDAIDDLKDAPEDPDGIQQIYTKHSPAFIEKIAATEIGKSVNPKYSEAFYRCPPDAPSNTVKENHGGVFVHYEKNRVMTPRELARLQSFPDDFVFKGKKSCMLVQLGNAVPCKLGEAVAGVVKTVLASTHA
jgi:site-specific DNA-cytosine methylase